MLQFRRYCKPFAHKEWANRAKIRRTPKLICSRLPKTRKKISYNAQGHFLLEASPEISILSLISTLSTENRSVAWGNARSIPLNSWIVSPLADAAELTVWVTADIFAWDLSKAFLQQQHWAMKVSSRREYLCFSWYSLSNTCAEIRVNTNKTQGPFSFRLYANEHVNTCCLQERLKIIPVLLLRNFSVLALVAQKTSIF